jgi:hypothetical protein
MAFVFVFDVVVSSMLVFLVAFLFACVVFNVSYTHPACIVPDSWLCTLFYFLPLYSTSCAKSA